MTLIQAVSATLGLLFELERLVSFSPSLSISHSTQLKVIRPNILQQSMKYITISTKVMQIAMVLPLSLLKQCIQGAELFIELFPFSLLETIASNPLEPQYNHMSHLALPPSYHHGISIQRLDGARPSVLLKHVVGTRLLIWHYQQGCGALSCNGAIYATFIIPVATASLFRCESMPNPSPRSGRDAPQPDRVHYRLSKSSHYSMILTNEEMSKAAMDDPSGYKAMEPSFLNHYKYPPPLTARLSAPL